MAIEEVSDWVPQACSLSTSEQPLRVAEFDWLFGESVGFPKISHQVNQVLNVSRSTPRS
ncbi:hypothetical protein [Mycolicibacterium fortuitum]|uniref:hypothetical protein n=1 Tax=Mycolicibacterium fortuitum TaxID=1766 RepID=UPI001F1CE5C9